MLFIHKRILKIFIFFFSNSQMAAFRVMIALCLAVFAAANPAAQLRAVRNPKTPNQIMDKIAEDTVAVMK